MKIEIDFSKFKLPRKGPFARLLVGAATFTAGFFADLTFTKLVAAAFVLPMADGGPTAFFLLVMVAVVIISFLMALHDIDVGEATDAGPG
jgi:hypothetical protein